MALTVRADQGHVDLMIRTFRRTGVGYVGAEPTLEEV